MLQITWYLRTQVRKNVKLAQKTGQHQLIPEHVIKQPRSQHSANDPTSPT